MKMIIRIVITCVLFVGLTAQAGVYKWVDERGNVHYSDQGADKKAKKVDLPENSTYSPPPMPTINLSSGKKKSGQVISNGYQSIEVSSPANDSVVRSAPGDVTVNVKVNPALRPGDKIRLKIDGKEKQFAASTSFNLKLVDRGSHTITATIVRGDGNEVLTSKPSIFHMKR